MYRRKNKILLKRERKKNLKKNILIIIYEWLHIFYANNSDVRKILFEIIYFLLFQRIILSNFYQNKISLNNISNNLIRNGSMFELNKF